MKYFENITTLEELKKEYRKLAFANHPDRGGELEAMQEINNEYDKLFTMLREKHNTKEENKNKQTTECPEEFREIVSKIINLDGIDIELCGSWIWLGGKTYQHKKIIKEVGFKWSKNKSMWYWRHEEEGNNFWYKGKTKIEEIRNKYGSEKITISKKEFIPEHI